MFIIISVVFRGNETGGSSSGEFVIIVAHVFHASRIIQLAIRVICYMRPYERTSTFVRNSSQRFYPRCLSSTTVSFRLRQDPVHVLQQTRIPHPFVLPITASMILQ